MKHWRGSASGINGRKTLRFRCILRNGSALQIKVPSIVWSEAVDEPRSRQSQGLGSNQLSPVSAKTVIEPQLRVKYRIR